MNRMVGVALLLGFLTACSGASETPVPSGSAGPRVTALVESTQVESRFGQFKAGGGIIIDDQRKGVGAPLNAWHATGARVDPASGCWVLIGQDGESYLPVLVEGFRDEAANGLQAGVYGGLPSSREAISLPSGICPGISRVLYPASF